MLLAYEVNGQPLPPQHGFPLRLIVPGWYGMTHVKWLERITVLISEPFEGYQQAKQYRTKQSEDELGDAVTRMLPRSLLIPPGIPDFPDRQRFLAPGPCTLEGRAWSGHGPVTRVEVSVDGGQTWADATLDGADGRVRLAPLDLRVERRRAGRLRGLLTRDRYRRQRPAHSTPSWNYGGYVNNAVQRVLVDCPRLTAPEDSAQEAGLLAFDLEAGRWLLERSHPRQLFR